MKKLKEYFLEALSAENIKKLEEYINDDNINDVINMLVNHSNKASIKKYAEKAIEDGKLCPGHIFNLGHGIMPATPVENVKYLIDVVKGLA